ncbi:MAG TPA: TPM domain-containing protein, partial [Gemmataceae bacterium]|nr:TPM domain-containing protein [Gemmataceae bacterium]
MVVRKLLLPLLLLGGALVSGPVHAQVQDDAGLFSADARKKADSAITEMRRRYGAGMLVRTVAEASPEVRRDYRAWTAQEAGGQGIDGVLVYIWKKPGHVQTAMRLRRSQQALFK